MAAGAIPPPLFFGRSLGFEHIGSGNRHAQEHFETPAASITPRAGDAPIREQDGDTRKEFETMANTTSAKKATRKIARRTAINKSRRTEMRGAVRSVEEAIKRGDRDAALKAMAHAEPELMRAAQRNIVHRNNASRKVSRLSHQIAKLAK